MSVSYARCDPNSDMTFGGLRWNSVDWDRVDYVIHLLGHSLTSGKFGSKKFFHGCLWIWNFSVLRERCHTWKESSVCFGSARHSKKCFTFATLLHHIERSLNDLVEELGWNKNRCLCFLQRRSCHWEKHWNVCFNNELTILPRLLGKTTVYTSVTPYPCRTYQEIFQVEQKFPSI